MGEGINVKAFLFLGLALIFITVLVSFIISSFVDVSANNYDGYLSPLVSFIKEGSAFSSSNDESEFLFSHSSFGIFGTIFGSAGFNIRFNPFSLLGGTLQNYLADSTASIGLLPSIIAIPWIFLITLCFLLAIIGIIQGFIP